MPNADRVAPLPRAAEALLLKMAVGALPTEPLVCRLFTDDRAPGADDVAATYREPRGAGYAPVPLRPGAWKLAERAVGGFELAHPEVAFEFSGPLDAPVFGYFVTRAGGGQLFWSARFEARDDEPVPYAIRRRGDRIFVTPALVVGPAA